MCIICDWHKNTVLKTENKEIPGNLMKNFYFSLFSDSLPPKLSLLMCITDAWHKNAMLETKIKEISLKKLTFSIQTSSHILTVPSYLEMKEKDILICHVYNNCPRYPCTSMYRKTPISSPIKKIGDNKQIL